MDQDFRGGPKKRKTIEPLNNLTEPKLPDFDTLDGTGEPELSPVPDTALPTTETAEQSASTEENSTPKQKSQFFAFRWVRSKRFTLIAAVIIVALVGGGVATAYFMRPEAKGGVSMSKKPAGPAKPTTVASSLTGLQVDPSVNNRPVTGVMIENSEDARPQSGIDQAGVVFEAIAEGGITRFLTLYQDSAPDYLGPVRSVRPYYLQWCMGFDCAIAHAGGSPEALADIKSWGAKDLDQFANGGSYTRIDSRYAPHNLYTSTAKLNELESAKGFAAASFTPLTRKKDAASKTPNASSIDLNISSYAFNPHFDYDAATNSYKRSQNGAAHTVVNAAGTEVQLQPKVVVVLITSYGIASDKHSQYGVTGSGETYVFQDGVVTKGTWHKDDTKTSLSLTNEAGQPLALNAGQTWFTALPGADKITYQ